MIIASCPWSTPRIDSGGFIHSKVSSRSVDDYKLLTFLSEDLTGTWRNFQMFRAGPTLRDVEFTEFRSFSEFNIF